MPHRRDKGEVRILPEYSWDYCFPGDEFGHKWTVLVGRERETRTVMATTVPNTWGIGRFASDKCWEFMEENGDKVNKVIVKTDQEPSIAYLIKYLVGRREEGQTIVEEAPVESKGSNGIVERTVQEVEGVLRSVYLGLQERLGRKVSTRERIVAFIPDYVGYLINRLKKGEDGKVGYERCKGKKPTVMGVEFGEKLLFRRRTGQKMEKLNERWQYGIFVGVRRRSNELMIATKLGIVMARSIKRIPVERRWFGTPHGTCTRMLKTVTETYLKEYRRRNVKRRK